MTKRIRRCRPWPYRIAMTCAFSIVSSVIVATATAIPMPPKAAPPLIVHQTMRKGVPMVSPSSPASPPEITSSAAVVVDMSTGTVVYAKNPLVEHYPASLTKIMTALLALQRGHLSDVLTTKVDATAVPPDKLYLVPGEEEPLQKLLYGLLTISANDAAVVIADHYGGSVSGFAKLMNQKAVALGASHTHFVNPNGLPDPNHVTTAYDLALITQAAMKIPEFRKIVDTKYYHWQGQAWSADLTNINHMLFNYPGAIGVKTGWTSAANETLVVAATRGNQTFLAVLLDALTGPQIDQDATALLDYAFSNFHTESLVRAGQAVGYVPTADGEQIPVRAKQTVLTTVPIQNAPTFAFHAKDPVMTHAILKDDVTGTLNIELDGHVIERDPLVSVRAWTPPTPSHFTDAGWLILVLGVVLAMLRYNRRSARRGTMISRYRL